MAVGIGCHWARSCCYLLTRHLNPLLKSVKNLFQVFFSHQHLSYDKSTLTEGQNLSSGFPTRSNTNRAVQPQRMTRGLGSSGIVLCNCSENKSTDQWSGHHVADLRLFVPYTKTGFLLTQLSFDRRTKLFKREM